VIQPDRNPTHPRWQAEEEKTTTQILQSLGIRPEDLKDAQAAPAAPQAQAQATPNNTTQQALDASRSGPPTSPAMPLLAEYS
jgi:hypothetical protein